ncbi:hypothetical protein [Kitasatospora sp. NPDC002522]
MALPGCALAQRDAVAVRVDGFDADAERVVLAVAAGAATPARAALVGGRPGVVSWREDGTPLSVLAFTVTDGRITAITGVVDPAKLAQLNLPDPA